MYENVYKIDVLYVFDLITMKTIFQVFNASNAHGNKLMKKIF